ncbi:MAG: ribosome maturation factor RimM [Helicobacteraceae bacterium]|nr:ribosome maturation factor RimM [Helicobacteraceae bacterium]
MQKDLVEVAKIGRSVGVKGDVILHILSDFPESLKAGNIYRTQSGDLTLTSYNSKKSLAKFKEINSKEEAKQIVNLILHSTKEESFKQCELKDDEYFWFEIIGAEVVENGEILGCVVEIDRFLDNDYLYIKTNQNLVDKKLPKNFLIPYTKRYIINVESLDSAEDSKRNLKRIFTQYCKEILENS